MKKRLEEINIRLNQAEKWISNLEKRKQKEKKQQSEQQKENNFKNELF